VREGGNTADKQTESDRREGNYDRGKQSKKIIKPARQKREKRNTDS